MQMPMFTRFIFTLTGNLSVVMPVLFITGIFDGYSVRYLLITGVIGIVALLAFLWILFDLLWWGVPK